MKSTWRKQQQNLATTTKRINLYKKRTNWYVFKEYN